MLSKLKRQFQAAFEKLQQLAASIQAKEQAVADVMETQKVCLRARLGKERWLNGLMFEVGWCLYSFL